MNNTYLEIAYHQNVLRDAKAIKNHYMIDNPVPLKTQEGEDLHWKITRQIQCIVDHNIEILKEQQNRKINKLKEMELKEMAFVPRIDYAPAVMIVGFAAIVLGVLFFQVFH